MNESAASHSGWQMAYAQLAPALAAAEARLKDAPLRSGAAGRALSEAEYGAWLRQQSEMIKQISRRLVEAAVAVSRAANAAEATGDVAALAQHCGEMDRCLKACADWGEAVWATTPPLAFAGSFAELRAIPGELVKQMGPYLAIIAGAKAGESGTRVVEIDIQPWIDRAARLGQRELRQSNPSKGSNIFSIITLLVIALTLLYACT